MNGIELIAAERERQIKKKGWTPEHDSAHVHDELICAAVAYAAQDSTWWPFKPEEFKPSTNPDDKQGRVRDLAKAGALIAAEIDRLQREIGEEERMIHESAELLHETGTACVSGAGGITFIGYFHGTPEEAEEIIRNAYKRVEKP